MPLFPLVTCKIDGSGVLTASMTEFPSAMVADFRFQASTDGSVDPQEGDSLVFAVRKTATSAPETASSATLALVSGFLTARLPVPAVLAGADGYAEELQPSYREGSDPFKPVAARLVLSRTVDGTPVALAASRPVWILPVSAAPVPNPVDPAGVFFSLGGVLYRLSVAAETLPTGAPTGEVVTVVTPVPEA